MKYRPISLNPELETDNNEPSPIQMLIPNKIDHYKAKLIKENE